MRKLILVLLLAFLCVGCFLYHLFQTGGWRSPKINAKAGKFSQDKAGVGETGLNWEDLLSRVNGKREREIFIRLLDRKKKELEKTHRVWVPLLLAVRSGRCDLVDLLLDHGFLGDGSEVVWNEVINACRIECASVLAQRGVRPPKDAVELMIKECPKPEMMEVLLQAGVDVNSPDESGFYPIHYLVAEKRFKLAELLIKHGANLDVKEKGLPLLCSVISDKRSSLESVKFLLNHGAKVNLCSDDFCPIHCAIYLGRKEMVSFLLDKGANLLSPPPVGKSRFYAFELASVYGGVDVLDMLVSRLTLKDRHYLFHDLRFWKALCHESNSDIEEDLSLLVHKYHLNPNMTVRLRLGREEMDVPVLSLISLWGNVRALKSMLELGGYARAGVERVRPIKFAALGRNVKTVEILLDHGANPFYVDKDRRWNLYHLILNSQDQRDDSLVELIKRLASYRVDPNKRSVLGRTPLMVAIISGRSVKVVRTLIEVGADVNAVDYRGWPVLLYALRFTDDPRIITLLLVKGAHVPESTPDGSSLRSLLNQNPHFSPSGWNRYIRSWRNWGLVLEQQNE